MQRHLNHASSRTFSRFLNGDRHFASFTQTKTHSTFTVPGNNQRRKAEDTTAFHYFRGASHGD